MASFLIHYELLQKPDVSTHLDSTLTRLGAKRLTRPLWACGPRMGVARCAINSSCARCRETGSSCRVRMAHLGTLNASTLRKHDVTTNHADDPCYVAVVSSWLGPELTVQEVDRALPGDIRRRLVKRGPSASF